MKAFICIATLLAMASADQAHHQAIKLGNAPSVSHSVHKPHGAHHASVASQPHAAPQSVHGYGGYEKPVTAVHAPAAVPHHVGYAPAPYHAPVAHAVHAPVAHAVHAAPAYHAAPAPYHAPVVHHAPAPYHAPVVAHAVHAAPIIAHAPVVHHAAPAYGHPAVKEEPAPYAYEYGVADDYSKAAFNAAETSDANGAVSGSYSVALPDGRTQHVKYTADHYNGYVADVSYEGVPVYPEAKPYHPAPAPAYHA